MEQNPLSVFGMWPEQSLSKRILLSSLTLASIITIIVPEVNRMSNVWRHFVPLMDNLVPMSVTSVSVIQLFNSNVNHAKFITMLKRITADWKRLNQSPNIEIIHKFAANGLDITKKYSAGMYSAMILYVLLPITPAVMDHIVPLNESRPRNYLFEVDYGVKSDDYYWQITAHAYFASFLCSIVIVTTDSMFFVVVEHASALFEIVGKNLQMIAKNKSEDKINEERSYKIICQCVSLHKDAISFATIIESAYTACLLGVVGLCLLGLSITGVQTLLFIDQPDKVLRYGSFYLAQIWHLYFNSIPGQKIMDRSSSIFDYAYSINWDDLTPRCQKLLILIMIRSLKPCQITAGKVYIISIANYSAVLQTSMSYFTVFSSMI